MSRRLSRDDKAAIERAGLMHRLAVENFYAMPLERLRRVVAAIDEPALTDAEREAVERAAVWMMTLARERREIQSAVYLADDAATLRALLARLGGEQ